MPSCAPCQLHLHTSFLNKTRHKFNLASISARAAMWSMGLRVPLMLAKVASLECVDHCHPFFSCKMFLNREAAKPSLSWRRSAVTAGFRRHSWGRPSDHQGPS